MVQFLPRSVYTCSLLTYSLAEFDHLTQLSQRCHWLLISIIIKVPVVWWFQFKCDSEKEKDHFVEFGVFVRAI